MYEEFWDRLYFITLSKHTQKATVHFLWNAGVFQMTHYLTSWVQKHTWPVHIFNGKSVRLVLQYFRQNATDTLTDTRWWSSVILLLLPLTVPVKLSEGRPCHREWCPRHLDEGSRVKHITLTQLNVLMKLEQYPGISHLPQWLSCPALVWVSSGRYGACRPRLYLCLWAWSPSHSYVREYTVYNAQTLIKLLITDKLSLCK